MISNTFKAPRGVNKLTYEGVILLGFTSEYYGDFYNNVVDPCVDQGLYILGLLELFHDTKF